MPGSVTISHHQQAVMISHDDAERLAWVLSEAARLLEAPGADRLTDEQAGALCRGDARHREELAHWARALAHDVQRKV
ncbi:hypothetical protein [Peterkaempfera griseoplana]|uniref:hypothetical protein n=1 Tax=Peterkaempfera griseoplana TaxID=66896 RepID=UPI0006E1A169|nr:hypothetical protein [Peterkaempfera griseoplana]